MIPPRTRAVVESARTSEERERLTRQLRRAVRRRNAAFDHGFLAAVRMAEAGASVERLREAVPTAAQEMYDTAPVALIEFSEDADTDVEIPSMAEVS